MFISLFVLTEQGNTNDLPPYNAAPAAYYPPPGQGVNPPAMNYGAPPVVIQQPPAGVRDGSNPCRYNHFISKGDEERYL